MGITGERDNRTVRKDRRTEKQKDERTKGRKDERTKGRKDERTKGRKDGRTEGRKDKTQTHQRPLCRHRVVCAYTQGLGMSTMNVDLRLTKVASCIGRGLPRPLFGLFSLLVATRVLHLLLHLVNGEDRLLRNRAKH